MTRGIAAALMGFTITAAGCGGSQTGVPTGSDRQLRADETAGGENLQDDQRDIDTGSKVTEPSMDSIEQRIVRARRLYRDLAFQASLEELTRAQDELEALLDAESTYELLDRAFLLRALDELALGDQQAARDALRQSVILRPERTALDPVEFSPEIRAEYELVRNGIRREAPFALATESKPSGATLELNGGRAGLTPLSVPLHDGRHYLVFRSPGHLAAPRIVDVDGEPLGVLRVELESLAPLASPVGEPRSKPLVRKWWFWTVIGVAVVGTSLGLYFGLRKQPEPQLVIARPAP